jgi:hypothetical protein
MVTGSNGHKIRVIVLKEKKNERTKREIYSVNYKNKKKNKNWSSISDLGTAKSGVQLKSSSSWL